MEFEKLRAVVIDLETTGLNKKTDRIIEIGAIRIREGKIAEEYSQLVNPRIPLSKETTDITGIDDEMLKDAPAFSLIADKAEAFLGDDILIGHSITGDFAFLKKAFVDLKPKGYSFEKKGIDTLKLARRFLPADEKKTLTGACGHFGISFNAHRALDDARATFMLLEKLYEQFGDKDPEAFEPFDLHFAVKRDTPVMKKQLQQLERLLQEKDITVNMDLSALTKSQASRMIDRIRAGERERLL